MGPCPLPQTPAPNPLLIIIRVGRGTGGKVLRMSRNPQKQADRGSQKWLQILINDHPRILYEKIALRLGLDKEEQITWRSPLRNDNFAEYRDYAALERLQILLPHRSLLDFWPQRGPVWDALAITCKQDLLLFEAKSHINELISTACRAKSDPLNKIQGSLEETQRFLGNKSQVDWTRYFYQYANRLAHLYFLRQVNQLRAYLFFIYFVNDDEMKGPSIQKEWEGAIKLVMLLMGLRNHKLSDYVIDIFIDVNNLK